MKVYFILVLTFVYSWQVACLLENGTEVTDNLPENILDRLSSMEEGMMSMEENIISMEEDMISMEEGMMLMEEGMIVKEVYYKNEIMKLREDVATRSYDLSSLPLGTILPYLPSLEWPAQPDKAGIPDGWMTCNGQAVPEGPWRNLMVPNLNDIDNGKGLFLRGSSYELAGTIQLDAIQSHKHEDSGHTHSDGGHTHRDFGHKHHDPGHTHSGSYATSTSKNDDFDYHKNDKIGVINVGYRSLPRSFTNIQSSSANISTNSANILSSKASIGSPSGKDVHVDTETRPANMRVVWIIKIQPAGWTPSANICYKGRGNAITYIVWAKLGSQLHH